jgi:hypothetical protein
MVIVFYVVGEGSCFNGLDGSDGWNIAWWSLLNTRLKC